MAHPYILCDVDKFFKDGKQDFYAPKQISMDLTEGQGESSIKLATENFYESFDMYNCYHDFKHKKYGKVFDKKFNYFFEPLSFKLFFNNKIMLALIMVKTKAALDFIGLLNDSGNFSLSPIEINYEKMEPIITEISGAWFADLKRNHLKSAGYFGSHVNQSEEYKQAAREGNISSLRMNYILSHTHIEHDISITKKGAVVLYDTFDRFEDELDVVMDIYNKLIKI